MSRAAPEAMAARRTDWRKSRGRAMATCFSVRRATWMVSLAGVLFGIGCGTKDEPARAAAPLDSPGLLAGYGFGEGAGTTTADASGNGFTGTLVGSPGWVTGKNGTGLSFNGFDDLRRPRQSERAPVHRKHDALGLGSRDRERGDDGQIVAKSDGELGLAAQVQPRHRSADLRRGGHRRRRQPRPALQQDGPGAEHLVPRRGGLQRHRRGRWTSTSTASWTTACSPGPSPRGFAAAR